MVERALASGRLPTRDATRDLRAIARFAKTTKTGDRAELAIDGRTFVKDQTIKIDLGVGACEDSIWGTSLIVSLLPYCPWCW